MTPDVRLINIPGELTFRTLLSVPSSCMLSAQSALTIDLLRVLTPPPRVQVHCGSKVSIVLRGRLSLRLAPFGKIVAVFEAIDKLCIAVRLCLRMSAKVHRLRIVLCALLASSVARLHAVSPTPRKKVAKLVHNSDGHGAPMVIYLIALFDSMQR